MSPPSFALSIPTVRFGSSMWSPLVKRQKSPRICWTKSWTNSVASSKSGVRISRRLEFSVSCAGVSRLRPILLKRISELAIQTQSQERKRVNQSTSGPVPFVFISEIRGQKTSLDSSIDRKPLITQIYAKKEDGIAIPESILRLCKQSENYFFKTGKV